MKIHIWLNKDEAVSGNITNYYVAQPIRKNDNKDYQNYIQVAIDIDEFTELEDSKIEELNKKEESYMDKKYDQEYSQDNWNKGIAKLKEIDDIDNNDITYPQFVDQHYGKE